MNAIFLYGSMRYVPLRTAVLGVPEEMTRQIPATLRDCAVRTVEGSDRPVLVSAPGEVTEGILLEVPEAARARLDYYEAVFGYLPGPCAVSAEDGTVFAQAYRPGQAVAAGAGWQLDDWASRAGAMATHAAHELMADYGEASVEKAAERYPRILARAGSWLMAQTQPMPATVRTDTGADAVDLVVHTRPYSRYFAVEEADVRFPRFNGGMSETVKRAVFMMGDAVTVLPYDPVRDRVLVVEQFRAGPYLRGDPRPWSLEPIAGRIDPGEPPEITARREAEEEAEITLGALHKIASYYASPGAATEYLHSYIGIAELPDGTAGVAGVDEEAEDIRGHVLSVDALLDLLASGEVDNGPLVVSTLALVRMRDALRAEAEAPGA